MRIQMTYNMTKIESKLTNVLDYQAFFAENIAKKSDHDQSLVYDKQSFIDKLVQKPGNWEPYMRK